MMLKKLRRRVSIALPRCIQQQRAHFDLAHGRIFKLNTELVPSFRMFQRRRVLAPSADACFLQVTLADQQADPNSPLFSIKSFEELGL